MFLIDQSMAVFKPVDLKHELYTAKINTMRTPTFSSIDILAWANILTLGTHLPRGQKMIFIKSL